MLKIDTSLLDTSRGDLLAATRFNAVLNAHGLYDGLRFVVRLSPRVHELVASLPNGIASQGDVSFEQIQAFSTYLHETIHWWQHAGSTCGLMLSLSYPAQTHANLNHLKTFLQLVGPVKSVMAWAEAHPGESQPGSANAIANIIINNQFDIEAYRSLATNPERAQALVDHRMFESVGHSYDIALSNSVFALASTFDRDLAFVPDPRVWKDELQKLTEAKVQGYYYGSPIELSPIGAYHIFEGQARFGQLQYLHFATGGRFDWAEAQEAGMMTPIYTAAFEAFLTITSLPRPATVDHPVVGLFLLICDIAANPGEAFPFSVPFPEMFVSDVDPGMRFVLLCLVIERQCPETAALITRYDAAEYAHVSTTLCEAMKTFSPLRIAGEINRWVSEGEGFRRCLEQHDLGKADLVNLPLQVLFGQFASFSRDKARRPHILCWPGANMAGAGVTDEAAGVFSRQSPLFVDRSDDMTIVPVVRMGRSEAAVMETFQDFYGGFSLYDLTRQWIAEDGPFRYDYSWLQPEGTPDLMKSWASRQFENTYGVSPDQFELLS
ncbi:MAG TPA: hypothetical protein VIA98_11260 [Allosphingosinicella sp.]|jgi:hypothetical protein